MGYTDMGRCGWGIQIEEDVDWGKTPYDLAAAAYRGPHKEVMEYLQSVMSEESPGVTAGQGMEDDMVPTEIKLMADKRSIDVYLKLLESGSEKKRDIRLVVVGKQGAGKTSLIRRLFGEEFAEVTNTNGIEIHKIKCKLKSDDGIWNKLDENYEETQTHARLFKEYVGKLKDKRPHQEPVESHINTPTTSVDKARKSETVSMQPEIMKPLEAAEPKLEPPAKRPVAPQQSNKSSDQAARDFETMLSAKSKVDVHDKEEYATFLLWDFAGDEEFYHTHQTFMSQNAIYLVVTKLNEADNPNAQALFRLWIDSIHCYSRQEEENSTSDKTPLCDNNPPVVIVGTWKDAVTSEKDKKKIEIACRKNLLKYTNELADDERGHIRLEYFISNKDDECSVFQQIRQNILSLAKGMKTWNKEYPLKFIQLEQQLQEKKKESPIISYQKIKDISINTLEPLSEKELKLFLEFHHELRALVYFKDHSDYIILDTQWLADAFKCIVTAEKFQASTTNQKKWNEFYNTGKLNNEVLEDIFKKETTILYDHKDYILNVMEKFDIIIRPNQLEGADENPFYYVPCMIKAEPYCDIYKMFNVTEDIGKRSMWLCFKFRFLPPHVMNHLIASLSRMYAVATVVDKGENKRQIALFKGTAVFEIQKTEKLRKLLVMTFPSLILIQVLEFGNEIKRGVYKNIANFVTGEINKIISAKFKMSNVEFEKKWECGLTKPGLVIGQNGFCIEQGAEYYCETCITTHRFIDEWSDLPSPPKSCKAASDVTPDIERISQTSIIQETPLKSSEAASGLRLDTKRTSLTDIISKNEQKCDHQSTIGDKYDYIVQQRLDISNILDRMITHLVISVKDRHCIQHNKSQDEQTKTLLDIVIERGGTTNNVFIDVLAECGYNELANSLKKESENKSQSSKIGLEDVPDYKIRLQKNYLNIIKTLKHNLHNDQ
ncbi:uncharacterized protein [Mytilus edulis]|uniref:uncharacterized protein n=1 Tax=Mytilus edulis TaxID=6550 RepID=UPI0039EECF58